MNHSHQNEALRWEIQVITRSCKEWKLMESHWRLAIGYWRLVFGSWALVMAQWLLAIGYWFGYRRFASSYSRERVAARPNFCPFAIRRSFPTFALLQRLIDLPDLSQPSGESTFGERSFIV